MNDALWFDRTGSALIECAGKDAATFLHNLSTNDIKTLPVSQGREAFFCTHTARVVGHAFITRLDAERFWADADPGQNAVLFKHLDRHLISEQLELRDRSAEVVSLRVVGADAARAIPEGADLAPLETRLLDDGVRIRRFPGWNVLAFDLFADPNAASAWRRRLLDAGVRVGSEDDAEALRIGAGFPKMGADMDAERFVAELDRIAASISYAKGCYLGQEPIVMARDRGQVNRKFLGLLLGSAEPPPHGSKVTKGDAEIGVVTSSVRSPRLGQTIALAYMRRGHWQPGTAATVGSSAAVVAALPFASPS